MTLDLAPLGQAGEWLAGVKLLGPYLEKIFGPAADQIGGMLADSLAFKRDTLARLLIEHACC
jgi:hypothetical protein